MHMMKRGVQWNITRVIVNDRFRYTVQR